MSERTPTIFQRENDPYLYLNVMGNWFCYNPKEEPLGSGAMGTVYLGYNVKTGEKVAIKRVKDAYANNPMIRERAKQEASLAFRHPNLVEMLGYCEYAPTTGPIFILSHYVNGMNIDKFVAANFANMPDRVERICKLIYPVLDALDYVHSRGVIHRDIKPSNIMVENESNVRLMDLGIARANGGNKFSSFGFIGTPEYSAPEQIMRSENHQVPIDSSTDIYALGLSFYELLTGNNPMRSEIEAETLKRQMTQTLPSSDKIPPRLMAVLLKATAKDQRKRYAKASDFKQAIQQAMLPEPTFKESLEAWMQANAIVWMSVLIGIFALIAACLIIFL